MKMEDLLWAGRQEFLNAQKNTQKVHEDEVEAFTVRVKTLSSDFLITLNETLERVKNEYGIISKRQSEITPLLEEILEFSRNNSIYPYYNYEYRNRSNIIKIDESDEKPIFPIRVFNHGVKPVLADYTPEYAGEIINYIVSNIFQIQQNDLIDNNISGFLEGLVSEFISNNPSEIEPFFEELMESMSYIHVNAIFGLEWGFKTAAFSYEYGEYPSGKREEEYITTFGIIIRIDQDGILINYDTDNRFGLSSEMDQIRIKQILSNAFNDPVITDEAITTTVFPN